jgi:hypothetical protein
MLKRWLPFLFVAVAFTFIPAQVANFSVRAQPNSLPLELVLKADRNTYRMSDTLHLETRITNIGEKEIYLWEGDLCWNPARGLSMRITGADGKDVQSPFLLDCVPPPPRQGNAYQFVKISSERFYGLSENFKLSELVNGPGEYDLDATFSSFLSSKWTAEFLGKEPIAQLSLWTMEQPTITSNRIHITVKP